MSLANGVEKLFRSDYSKLVRALSFTYGLDAAADAVQEAFIAADRNWWRVRHYGNPSAWVSRVAVNSLKSGRRNDLRRDEILRSLPDASQTPATEAAMDLRHAIDSLPERMRLAICLHYLADLPVDQVADLLGCTSGTIKSNLHDARSRLRTDLTKADNG